MPVVLLLVRAGPGRQLLLGITWVRPDRVPRGQRQKKRVHIFWQRRIREGDTTTPWWFPAKTDSGAMREDRLVFPIPPGLSWRGEMPVLRAPEHAALPEKSERAEETRSQPVAASQGR